MRNSLTRSLLQVYVARAVHPVRTTLVRLAVIALLALPRVFAQTVTYKYDSGGHLVQANYGSSVITYGYDAAGHLTSRQIGANPCAVTGDGAPSVADIQAEINAALGKTPRITSEDLNKDETINVVDVQILIDVVLGAAPCPN